MDCHHKAFCFIVMFFLTFLLHFLLPKDASASEVLRHDYVYVIVQCLDEGKVIALEVGNFDQNLSVLKDFSNLNRKNCANETEITVPLSREYDYKRIHFYLEGKIKLNDEKFNYRHLTYYWKILELFKEEGWGMGQGKYIGYLELDHEFLPKYNDFAARASVNIYKKPVCKKNFYEEQTGTKSFCPGVVAETLKCINE